MAIVLTPILKTTTSKIPEQGTKAQRVSFSVPGEEIKCVVDYLKNNINDKTSLTTVTRVLLSPDTRESLLTEWLREFIDNIFFLDKENERLTSTLLRMRWVDKTESFIALYQELILNLVSAHPFYLKPVFSMIIRIFYPEKEDNDTITEAEVVTFNKAHRMIKSIVKIVPASPILLCALVLEKFPYMKKPVHVMNCYIKNMLDISNYLPSKSSFLLECIVDRLLRIDVFCSKDLIEQYELDKEEQETVFAMEEESEEKSSKKSECMAYPLAHNLDVQMDCLFNFIKVVCYSQDASKLNWDSAKKLYKELLTIFDKIILPTHACCHVQFVMFYICSLRSELAEGFLDYLWKKVQNFGVAPVIRQIAAFYIGSLLARATYIGINTVTACFDLMCSWIHSYIDNQDANSSHDMSVHGTFHSVCQTIFYVFAFRHQELLEIKESHKYLRSLNFDRIVTCRLNPLKFCQRTIVQNFANVARHYQIAYCYPVIERNNRSLMCSFMESAASPTLSGAMVQTFFPFDPYILKRSKHWVETLYRTYNAHKDDADISIELEESSHDLEISTSNSMLFSYGESPGFKTTLSPQQIR